MSLRDRLPCVVCGHLRFEHARQDTKAGVVRMHCAREDCFCSEFMERGDPKVIELVGPTDLRVSIHLPGDTTSVANALQALANLGFEMVRTDEQTVTAYLPEGA